MRRDIIPLVALMGAMLLGCEGDHPSSPPQKTTHTGPVPVQPTAVPLRKQCELLPPQEGKVVKCHGDESEPDRINETHWFAWCPAGISPVVVQPGKSNVGIDLWNVAGSYVGIKVTAYDEIGFDLEIRLGEGNTATLHSPPNVCSCFEDGDAADCPGGGVPSPFASP